MISLYQKALDALPSPVFLVDDNCKVIYCNRLFSDLFGGGGLGLGLGDVIGCTQPRKVCGEGEKCATCGLRNAVKEAHKSPFGTYRGSVRKTVAAAGGALELSFDISVCDLGGGYMGVLNHMHGVQEDIAGAARMQQSFLPDKGSDVGAVFDYLYLPVRGVGGDLLDVYREKNKTCAFVADVSGKGVTAAMLTSFIKATFRRDIAFAKALRGMQKAFCKLKTDDRSYITMLTLSVSAESNRAVYCSAGHSLPLLRKRGNTVAKFYAPAPPVSGWFENVNYRSRTVGARPGDLFVLATDGVTDCVGKEGRAFGLDRLCEVLKKADGASGFLRSLEAELRAFCDKQTDDVTVLVVEA